MTVGLRLSKPQRLALRAALLPGEAGAAAWQAWLRTLDFERDHTDPASFNVLPWVYRGLSEAGLDIAHGARLKGVYRQAWYRSALTLSQAPPLLQALHQAGQPFVLLHAPDSLRDQGARPGRPLLSLDLWLPSRHVARAAGLLLPLGWQPKPTRGPTQNFETNHGARLRLVTRPWPGPSQPAASALQAGSVPVNVSGVPAPAISPLDFVLYAGYRAAHGQPERRLAYLADAAHTLHQPLLALGSLGARARDLGVVVAVRRALSTLGQLAPSDALREAQAALAATGPTLREWAREATHLHPAVRRLVSGVRQAWRQGRRE